MKYKRILLKLSGEALMGGQQNGIDPVTLMAYCEDVKKVAEKNVQVAIVIGGGNIFRGMQGAAKGFDRVQGDYMGMMATVINSMALQGELENQGVKVKLLSGLHVQPVTELMSGKKAIQYLNEGNVVIIAGGTGNPFFTTDTAAALRGAEIGAEIVLKATKVDGVYSADPKKDPTATRYSTISFDDAMSQNLGIMDATAFALCRDQKLPVKVFSIFKHGALKRVVMGEDEGTLVYA